MSKGISLHIGINRVDDAHYRKTIFAADGWAGELKGCEADAQAMQALAEQQGFETQLLQTTDATRANVKQHIKAATTQLQAGDTFFITYSGHGSQVRDMSGDEKQENDSAGDHKDRRDETWCLFDAQLLDDELHHLWAQFKKDVRILIFSDSCHSGTVSRGEEDLNTDPPEGIAYRLIPKASLGATYKVHRDFYDSLQSAEGVRPEIAARVLLFSGCQDEELSRESQDEEAPGGLFTKSILKVWQAERPETYKAFFEAVKAAMPDDKQTPNYYVFGGPDEEMENSVPLEVGEGEVEV